MNNKLVNKFLELGVEKKLAVATSQVYIDLCEVKKCWDVTYNYNDLLKKVILQARRNKNDPLLSFVPVLSYDNFSFEATEQILSAINETTVFLGIVHPDSTTIYYQISAGLVEPTEVLKNRRENRQERLDNNLKKHTKLLEQSALCGIPVTLPKSSEKATHSKSQQV